MFEQFRPVAKLKFWPEMHFPLVPWFASHEQTVVFSESQARFGSMPQSGDGKSGLKSKLLFLHSPPVELHSQLFVVSVAQLVEVV